MRIKCFKLPCEVCNQVSTVQVFLRANGEVSYGRARHYQRLNEAKKPVFEYHPQSKEYLTEKLKFILAKIDQKQNKTKMQTKNSKFKALIKSWSLGRASVPRPLPYQGNAPPG